MDTEFAENGVTIKLISIGIVAEDGREYYAVARDGWETGDCSAWVTGNVVEKLPPFDDDAWKTRSTIRSELLDFLKPSENPEIWGYFCDYDWVVFCQLWGPMQNLPDGMPFWCRDLKQEMWNRGILLEALPVLEEKDAHSAIVDARWTRDAWKFVMGRALVPGRVDIAALWRTHVGGWKPEMAVSIRVETLASILAELEERRCRDEYLPIVPKEEP